jgi:hypothetical protein
MGGVPRHFYNVDVLGAVGSATVPGRRASTSPAARRRSRPTPASIPGWPTSALTCGRSTSPLVVVHSGGLITYLTEGFGLGRLVGITSWLGYMAAVVVVTAMVAVSFGGYAISLFIGNNGCANASRSALRCSASVSSYASAPSSFSRRVEPSTSVKSKVTVPVGRSAPGNYLARKPA